MKVVQQEILLIMGTSFLENQPSEKDENGNRPSLTEKDQLEEACWNGQLSYMLPELLEEQGKDRQMFLWQIKEGKSFIDLELSEYPATFESRTSIDPYAFLPLQFFS